MNAYPVANHVKDPKVKSKELIIPMGQPLSPDESFKENVTLELHGMGHYKRK